MKRKDRAKRKDHMKRKEARMLVVLFAVAAVVLFITLLLQYEGETSPTGEFKWWARWNVCRDFDDGLNYYVNSSVVVRYNSISHSYADMCLDNFTVAEGYCQDQLATNFSIAYYNCTNGCYDGKCRVSPITTCTDFDHGLNYATASYVIVRTDSNVSMRYDDTCKNRIVLAEGYCPTTTASTFSISYYNCTNGCSDGRCA
jgi:hypothetical protein